jgi:hypothetical protein
VEIEVTPSGAIEVRDNGHGVPAKNRKRIFERFWRGEGASGDGAGLGLSIVQAIATRHRETVTVGDNPGGGAVFRLQFTGREAGGGDKPRHLTFIVPQSSGQLSRQSTFSMAVRDQAGPVDHKPTQRW